MDIGSLLPRHVRYRPDHLAVVCGGERLTFREVSARVNRLANALSGLGLRKGDKLAVILPNCMELLDTYRSDAPGQPAADVRLEAWIERREDGANEMVIVVEPLRSSTSFDPSPTWWIASIRPLGGS